MKKIYYSLVMITLIIVMGTFSNKIYAATPVYNCEDVSKIYVIKGKKVRLKAPLKKVEWSTSNKKIAKISANGKITAKEAGKVKVIAKNKKKKYVINLIVKNKLNKANRKTVLLDVKNDNLNNLLKIQVNNLSEQAIINGQFALEYYEKGKWIGVPTKEQVVDALPYEIIQSGDKETYNKFLNHYEMLEGKYRVVCTFRVIGSKKVTIEKEFYY